MFYLPKSLLQNDVFSDRQHFFYIKMNKTHIKNTPRTNPSKTNKISTFPPPRSVPRTTPDDQNRPRGGPDPPRTPSENRLCFRCLPGPPRGAPGASPGPPQRPPGTPQRRRGPSQGPPGTSQRPPRTPRGNPREPEDLLRTRQRSQGTPQTLSSRPGGMREAIKSAAPCQSREQGVSRIHVNKVKIGFHRPGTFRRALHMMLPKSTYCCYTSLLIFNICCLLFLRESQILSFVAIRPC